MKYLKLYEQFKSTVLNEGYFDSLSKEQIDKIIYDDDLNSAMNTVHGFIGQKYGDTAGIYFSNRNSEDEWKLSTPDERLYHLQNYLEMEDNIGLDENNDDNDSVNIWDGDDHEEHSCKTCGEDMIEGYVVDGNTYCSDECRRKDYTDEEYEDKYDSDDTDEAYWTQWF